MVKKKFNGFKKKDFDVFKVKGLEERMEALKVQIQPKFELLGEYFSPSLTAMTGDEIHYHVAKHARRTINAPKDSWVAFANNQRGYKMLPHFQIGLWETHVFIWFAVIYEAPMKEEYGEALLKDVKKIRKEIPSNYVWSKDHTKPEVIPQSDLTEEQHKELFKRLKTVKKAEILCGIQIPMEEAIKLSGDETIARIEEAFQTLRGLYNLSKEKV
ncbi:YktB family protein [Sutcliffiella rhizosphaerae]|uniref:UPF0637 protein BACCIP111883_00636 n=1 Tax=Sutcliffiella rhizosphaerae TaxID=2880967 RepID=A0ABM8YIX9_9BACI|nr:DUF1054 domain-containing protein [Sutcliffiella rhizosphaerae]CAG9619868.1 hypothetical protein BACCIP111883_00636 [Sutcliffiella rhizosphaerae]